MRRRRARCLVTLALVGLAARAAPGSAQVEAGLDAAASVVKSDGFLTSAAAAFTPSVSWRSPRTTLAARGTLLAFESGNTSLQGLLTAGTFSPPIGPLRIEAAAEAGGSAYAASARFAHALGRLRAHLLAGRWGIWAGPLLGAVSPGDGPGNRRATGFEAGAWGRLPAGALEVAWTRVAVAGITYRDVEARARWRRGAFDVAGDAGARDASRGGASGLYGDLSAALRLTDWLALTVSGGLYPSDPVNGTIAGRFVTAGVRLSPRPAPRVALVRQIGPSLSPSDAGTPARLEGVRVTVEQLDGLSVLIVRVTGARRVEVMGDFTDWQPVALAAAGEGRYRFALGLPPGMQRFNLRLDGGPWGVPLGAGIAADEFGGSVGVLVVP